MYNHRSHPIQPLLGLFPLRHNLSHKPVKPLAVVMLGDVTELVQNDVIYAFPWRLYQVWVQSNSAFG